MKENPFEIERRLTPELYDHCVANARAERAQAIAGFGRWIAQQLRIAAARLASRAVRPRSAQAASKLPV